MDTSFVCRVGVNASEWGCEMCCCFCFPGEIRSSSVGRTARNGTDGTGRFGDDGSGAGRNASRASRPGHAGTRDAPGRVNATAAAARHVRCPVPPGAPRPAQDARSVRLTRPPCTCVALVLILSLEMSCLSVQRQSDLLGDAARVIPGSHQAMRLTTELNREYENYMQERLRMVRPTVVTGVSLYAPLSLTLGLCPSKRRFEPGTFLLSGPAFRIPHEVCVKFVDFTFVQTPEKFLRVCVNFHPLRAHSCFLPVGSDKASNHCGAFSQ